MRESALILRRAPLIDPQRAFVVRENRTH